MKNILKILLLFICFATNSQNVSNISPVVTDGTSIKYIDSTNNLVKLKFDLGNSSFTTNESNDYVFDPIEWEIGTDPVKNKIQFQKAINHAKSTIKGYVNFRIGKCDFSVACSGSRKNIHEAIEAYGIILPSDFHLSMTSESFIRVAPNPHPSFCLIGVFNSKNTKVSGGNLIGDIEEHTYGVVDGDPSHEYGAVLCISGAKDWLVDGVSIQKGTGDNIMIGETGFRPGSWEDLYPNAAIHYSATERGIIQNCDIGFAGRNGISPLSGTTILIQNNTIHDTAQIKSTPNAPACGIDTEAYRYIDNKEITHPNGEIHEEGHVHEFERNENFTIINNKFFSNKGGAVNLFTIHGVLFSGNYCIGSVGSAYGRDVRIIGNYIQADPKSYIGTGFYNTNTAFNVQGERAASYRIEVSGNTIIGFEVGAALRNQEINFHNNIVSESKVGISLGNLKQSSVHHNAISSSVEDSKGITATGATLDRVNIYNNDIDVDGMPIHLFSTNNKDYSELFEVDIYENELKSMSKFVFLQQGHGLNFNKNTLKCKTIVENLTNFTINDNQFDVRGASLTSYYNMVNGTINYNRFAMNGLTDTGIVLSVPADKSVNDVFILKNDFVGKTGKFGIQVRNAGLESNLDIKDNYFNVIDVRALVYRVEAGE